MNELVMMMGGDADGRVINFDTNKDHVLWPKAVDLFARTFDYHPDTYDTYNRQRIYTPDRWLQVVLVHQDVDLAAVPESELIRAIMTVWRAKHREQAESGLGHAPSGFAVTEEMLRDEPSIVDRIMRHGRA